MRTRRYCAALATTLAICCLAQIGSPVRAGIPGKLSRRGLTTLCRKAAAAYDLRAKGAKPFRLVAEYQSVGTNGKVSTSTLTLNWQSPQVWREVVAAGGAKRTLIRSGEKGGKIVEGEWTRQDDGMVSSLRFGLELSKTYQVLSARRVSVSPRILESGRQVVDLVFPDVEGPFRRAVRLDRKTGELLMDIPGRESRTVYENQQYGDKLVPLHIKFYDKGKQNAEWKLVSFAFVDHPDAAEFDIPEGAAPLTPCDEGRAVPKLVKTVNPLFPEEAAPGLVVMQVKIGLDGRIVDAVVLKSTNKELDKAALDAVRKWRYRLPPCEKLRAPIPWVVTAKFRGTIW